MKYIQIKDDGKLKTSEILDKCRKLFPIYSWYSDEQLNKDFPPVKSSRKFKYVQEADEELANKSANDLEEGGIEGITLRERLLFELEYFKKEKKHLDVVNITLCSGSRDSDGDVPYVLWNGGGLGVSWRGPSRAHARLRSRAAVSNPRNSKLETLPLELDLEIKIKGKTYYGKVKAR